MDRRLDVVQSPPSRYLLIRLFFTPRNIPKHIIAVTLCIGCSRSICAGCGCICVTGISSHVSVIAI